MKPLSLLLLVSFCFSCSNSKKITASPYPLNGVWVPVKQELGGKQLPPAAFATQSLVISDTNYVFTAESVDKGAAVYKDGKMDIYGREGVNTGKHFNAIYKMENEELSICYNLMGNGYPASFDTKGQALYFMSVFKKK